VTSSAGEGLPKFQEQNQADRPSRQRVAPIEAAARLKSDLMASEVQLQVMPEFRDRE